MLRWFRCADAKAMPRLPRYVAWRAPKMFRNGLAPAIQPTPKLRQFGVIRQHALLGLNFLPTKLKLQKSPQSPSSRRLNARRLVATHLLACGLFANSIANLAPTNS
jgi:hypothetical protein